MKKCHEPVAIESRRRAYGIIIIESNCSMIGFGFVRIRVARKIEVTDQADPDIRPHIHTLAWPITVHSIYNVRFTLVTIWHQSEMTIWNLDDSGC